MAIISVESVSRLVKGKTVKGVNTVEEIINLLLDHEGSYLSGEFLAKTLHCSRAAIWKWMQILKKEGFIIDSHPQMGYRLLSYPDTLLPPLIKRDLKTSWIGQEIYYLPRIDSTNLVAKKLAEKGIKNGTLIITDEQLKGRGRLGRSWFSSPKKDLLFTLIFYPEMKPLQIFRITMLSSVAISEAIEKETGLKPLIKWPNDLYLYNKKFCGILTEFSGEQDQINYCLLGIGINVNSDTSSCPEIKETATSLTNCLNKKLSRVDLLKSILVQIEEYYELLNRGAFAWILERWKNRSLILGREVVVSSGNEREYGIAESFDEDGHLILKNERGERKKILSGDVSLKLR